MLLPLAESVRTYFQAHGFPTIVDRICLEESLAPPVPHSVDALRLGWCFLHILSILPQTASIVSASFPVPLLAEALGISILAGLVAGAFPAWRGAQLSPVEALRHD